MPADILTTDTLFPELNGGESTDQKFEMVTDYLWLLREQLTYALTNLGIANFNQTQLGKLSGIIAEPLKVVLAEQETQFTEFGVELGLISGRITNVEKTVGNDESGLVQKMAAFELQADGFTQSFTEIGKVLNGEDGESGLVKDVADASGAADEAKQAAETVAGNYISKSAVTQTAEGFELEVVGTNSSGVSQTRMKMTADGLQIYNKAGVAVLDFDTDSGDLEVQGTIEGSNIYGSSLYTCKKGAKSTDEAYMILDDNGLISVNKGVKNGISVESNTSVDGVSEIGFYRTGFRLARIGSTLSNVYIETESPGYFIGDSGNTFDFTKPWINLRVPGSADGYEAADIRLAAEAGLNSSLIQMSAVDITSYVIGYLTLGANRGTQYPSGIRIGNGIVEIYATDGVTVNGTRIG